MSLPQSEQWDVTTPFGARRIFLGAPEGPAPAKGFPLLVVLDANMTFATAFDSMRLQSRRTASTFVEPMIVVGVGYPTDDLLDVARRENDFTGDLRARSAGALAPCPPLRNGGADFLDFLEAQACEAVGARLPVNPARRALFGHSLGGLFVLKALFARRSPFAAFIAASPSIWWGERAILRDEAEFVRNFDSHAAARKLLVTVGQREQAPAAGEPGVDPDRRRSLQQKRMVDNAREMAGRLERLPMDVGFVEFPDENHASVLPGAIARALRFASRV